MNDLHELAICGESLIIVLSCCIINGLNGHTKPPPSVREKNINSGNCGIINPKKTR